MKLPVLAQDKANHAVYGNVIFVVAVLLGLLIGADVGNFAAWVTILVACVKEVYDRETGLGLFDRMDTLATIVGAIPAAVLLKVLA